ncbi:MAG TPA: acetyl-CoA hydrolase/transferase C-terminal domain-containing protein [Stellaceae bacterium]|jgi:acetyl-CoA hydrolase|nr:acetyl-CoA hydrolase/transferase C-terminal domain-containing protein [Stellaceae bacterium]
MTTTIELSRLDFRDWVRPDDMVAWGQASGEPLSLTEALMAQRHTVGPFKAFTGISLSPTPNPQFTDRVEFHSYHGGASNRRLVETRQLEILPCHYSQLPAVLAGKVDVLLLHLPPPDDGGNFSLGLSHDYVIALIDSTRTVIAEINDQMPWIHGERTIHAAEIDVLVTSSRPPLEMPLRAGDAADRAIAARVAGLIEDGATLQIGIGALPGAILVSLAGHRHLGIHSGAIGDTVAGLMESGAVDNARKGIDAGVTVAGCLLGTRRIWDFSNRNPRISLRSVAYTHDIFVLSGLEKFTALNGAIEVDLTGQVNAETLDGNYVGAVGGAVDFMRGAQRSRGGLPIIALRSRAGDKSKIVGRLGGPVSTARADAGVIVTEHGIADLRGRTIAERVKRMIDIAHPEDRDSLERAAYDVTMRNV